jgi:hypothetical protein
MATFQVVQIFVDTSTPEPIVVYTLAVSVFGIICCLVTYTMDFKEVVKSKTISTNDRIGLIERQNSQVNVSDGSPPSRGSIKGADDQD